MYGSEEVPDPPEVNGLDAIVGVAVGVDVLAAVGEGVGVAVSVGVAVGVGVPQYGKPRLSKSLSPTNVISSGMQPLN